MDERTYVIFKPTVQQAGVYNATLERINSVGMAWTVLETMPEDDRDQVIAKNRARESMINAILGSNGSNPTTTTAIKTSTSF